MPTALQVNFAASFAARLQALEAILLTQDPDAASRRRQAQYDDTTHARGL